MKKYRHNMVAEHIKNYPDQQFYQIVIDGVCIVDINPEVQNIQSLVYLLNSVLGKGKYILTFKGEE